ncbi:MAG: glycosyltransferase family 2 protein [bacterium]
MANPGNFFISVAAPAYNESEVIAEVVKEWVRVLEEQGHDWEIIIADDGSTDGTADIIRSLGRDNVRVVAVEGDHGYGPALSQALQAAGGDYIVTLDSDGQFRLSDFPPLLAKLLDENLDLVSGRRRGKKDKWTMVLSDRILNLVVRVLFCTRLRDTNCALKVFRKEVASSVKIEAAGIATPTELVVRAARQGFRLGEHPVDHLARLGGKGKFRILKSGFHFLAFALYLRLRFWLEDWKVIRKDRS